MRGGIFSRLRAIALVVMAMLVIVSGGSWVVAQGTPPSESDLQTKVAEQQATISAQATQISDLKTRVSDVSGSKKPGATTAASSAGTSAEPLAVGETYSGLNWDITVTGFEFAPTLDTNYQQNVARGIFCIVYITVMNNGNDPAPFPYADLQLKTSEGRTYSYDDQALFNLTYVVMGAGGSNDDLQPGLAYTTAVLFDIPPDATGLVLTAQSSSTYQVKLEQP